MDWEAVEFGTGRDRLLLLLLEEDEEEWLREGRRRREKSGPRARTLAEMRPKFCSRLVVEMLDKLGVFDGGKKKGFTWPLS